MEPDPALVETIKRKIATFEREQILEAVGLTENFPPPGPEPADIAAQVLHDVALHAESLGEWPLCASLYRRSLAYPTVSPRIPIGNWFRYGLCQEHMGALREAIAGYRNALSYGDAWPHVTALARKHLAELLMAAEEFQQARAVLEQLSASLPHPEIQSDQVALELARCLLRLGERKAALERLQSLSSQPTSTEAAVEALQLLADLHEQAGNLQAAAACYRRIIQSGAAESNIKAAAAYRLGALQRAG